MYFRLIKKPLMPATLTYSPLTPQTHAERLRTNTRRYARYAEIHPVPPLKGLQETRAASVPYRASVPAGHAGCGVAPSYRALSPDGDLGHIPYRPLLPICIPLRGKPAVRELRGAIPISPNPFIIHNSELFR